MIQKQDIVCPEAVKLDDIDGAAVTKNFEAAKAKAASAEAGSMEAAEAMIEVETNRAMGNALGLALAQKYYKTQNTVNEGEGEKCLSHFPITDEMWVVYLSWRNIIC